MTHRRGTTLQPQARTCSQGWAHATVVIAAIVLLCVSTPAHAQLATRRDANSTYALQERFWLPYEADGATLSMFSLSEKKNVDEMLEGALEEAMLGEDDGLDTSAGAEGNVPDSGPRQMHARAEGGFEFVRDGKVGGSIRFGDQDAPRITTARYSPLTGRGWRGGIEAWFKPDAQPNTKRDSILLVMSMRSVRDIEARLLADGRVTLTRGDETLGTTDKPVITFGQWHHVAIMGYWAQTERDLHTQIEKPKAPGLRLTVDGHTIVDIAADAGWVWTDGSGVFHVGNRLKDGKPFVGLIDEIRVSSRDREYYPLEKVLIDPQRARDLPEGWPVLRDKADVIVADGFEAIASNDAE